MDPNAIPRVAAEPARSALDFFPPGKVPRPEQRAAVAGICDAWNAGRRVVALQAPTGTGKSYCGMGFARQTVSEGGNVSLITIQKMLQAQYATEFPAPEVELVMGRSNYPCSYDPFARNAAQGTCRRVRKAALIPECLRYGTVDAASKFELSPAAHKCDYWAQMARGVQAGIALFNFQSFLYQQRLGRFGWRNLMVLDEAHNAESVLMQFVQIVFSDAVLKKLGVRLDLRLKTAKDVLAWLDREEVSETIKEALGDAARSEGCAEGLTPAETDRLQGLLARIEDLRKYLDLTEWVVDVTEDADEEDPKDRTRKLRVRPVFVGLFAREHLWSKASRILAMSATILDPKTWARNLGIAFRDLGEVEVPCPFPVENRPIVLDYAGDMSWKHLEETLPKLYLKIGEILARHRGQRGIVHAHSERLVRRIMENVASPRFVHLDMFPNRDKTTLLKAHAAKADSVIVASAMHEGVDLKDDLARFAIIAKVPWPSTEDALVKARMERDGGFLPYQTALKLVQSYGRACRHEKDWATTIITDAGFESFLRRCGWLLPSWFTDAIAPESAF